MGARSLLHRDHELAANVARLHLLQGFSSPFERKRLYGGRLELLLVHETGELGQPLRARSVDVAAAKAALGKHLRVRGAAGREDLPPRPDDRAEPGKGRSIAVQVDERVNAIGLRRADQLEEVPLRVVDRLGCSEL